MVLVLKYDAKRIKLQLALVARLQRRGIVAEVAWNECVRFSIGFLKRSAPEIARAVPGPARAGAGIPPRRECAQAEGRS
jgi:hypothetical protein